MLAGEALWQVAKEVCHQQCQSPLKELELNQCRLEKIQDRISLSSCFSGDVHTGASGCAPFGPVR